MTKRPYELRKKDFKRTLGIVICIFLTSAMLILSIPLKEAIIKGVRLSAYNIIPTLFPFFILADLWTAFSYENSRSRLTLLFERTFKINGCAITAFSTGIICGFPVGARTAAVLYERGLISRGELEDLCGFINNPSLAFVISGIGIGIYGSVKVGILLYTSVLISAVLTGLIVRSKHKKTAKTGNISEQKFNLVNSIKSAGISSITVATYIIFFSGVIGIISYCVKNPIVTVLLSALSEVSNAAVIISVSLPKNHFFTFSATAFALGFSGFSVHLQAFSFLPSEVSRSNYLLMKLFQGIVASIIIIPLILLL